MKSVCMDGIFIRLGSFRFEWNLWETYDAYDAEEQGGRVFIREQRRKFIPKKRRIVTYPKGHEKRQ